MKKIFLFLLLTSILVVGGCSQEDCSLKDTTYEKFELNEDTGKCFIATKITKDKCGNGIAEPKDGDACECPKDIPESHPTQGCSETVGEYLEESCSEKKCILLQNDKVIEEIKAIQLKNTDIILDGIFTFNNPFILNSADNNKITIDLSFLKVTSASKKIKNFVVKEIRLEGGNSKIIGSATYNENLEAVGETLSRKQLDLADTDEYEDSESIKVKLMISYTLETYKSDGTMSKTEDKIETLSGSLGKVNLINPNFDPE